MTTSGRSRRSGLLPRGGALYSRCRAAPKVRIAPFGGSAAASAASVGILYSRCRAAPKRELLLLRGQRSGVSRKRGGTLLTSIGIHDAARTLRHLAPIAVAKAYADALVTHDAAQKPFGLTAVQLFGELRPAIDNGTWGCRHASSRRNGVGSDLGCGGRSRRRGDSRRDGRTALDRC